MTSCKCSNCNKPCDPESDLCRGCGNVVCADCAIADEHWWNGEHIIRSTTAKALNRKQTKETGKAER